MAGDGSGDRADYAALMAYRADDARRDLLERVAEATDDLGVALAALGAAYEQLDTNTADRLEEQLFRPAQLAYGRARRVHSGFAERTSPLASSTCTCCTTAASDMSSGCASSLTDAGPRVSRSTIRRRLGSARAWKTRPRKVK